TLTAILLVLSVLRLRLGVRVRNRQPSRRQAFLPPGSWKALFRFSPCIGTMNRGLSRAGRKAPINRTHSRRFARFEDARLSRSVWSAFVFRGAFPKQAAVRWPGRFMESPLSFFGCIGP